MSNTTDKLSERIASRLTPNAIAVGASPSESHVKMELDRCEFNRQQAIKFIKAELAVVDELVEAARIYVNCHNEVKWERLETALAKYDATGENE